MEHAGVCVCVHALVCVCVCVFSCTQCSVTANIAYDFVK